MSIEVHLNDVVLLTGGDVIEPVPLEHTLDEGVVGQLNLVEHPCDCCTTDNDINITPRVSWSTHSRIAHHPG